MAKFMFYDSYYTSMMTIKSKSKRWDLIEAIYNYIESGVMPEMSKDVYGRFLLIKPIIDKEMKHVKKSPGNPNFKKGEKNIYEEKAKEARKKSIVLKNQEKIKELSNSLISQDKDKDVDENEDDEINLGAVETNSKSAESDQIIGIDYTKNSENNCNNNVKSAKRVKTSVEKLKNVLKNSESDQKTTIIPSLDDVKSYIIEQNLSVDGDIFYNFYESKGWMIGKNAIKDYKAALKSWDLNSKRGKNGKVDDNSLISSFDDAFDKI